MVCPVIAYPFCMIRFLAWFWWLMSRSQNSKSTSPISVDAKELAGLMISVEDEVTSELLSSTGATLMACSPDHLRFIFRAAPVYHGVTRLIHRPNHQPRTHCYWSKQTTNTRPGMILHQNGARAPVLLDVFFNLALGRSQWYWCVPVVPRSTEWRGIFSSTTTTSARDVTTGCYLVYTPRNPRSTARWTFHYDFTWSRCWLFVLLSWPSRFSVLLSRSSLRRLWRRLSRVLDTLAAFVNNRWLYVGIRRVEVERCPSTAPIGEKVFEN